MTENVQSIPAGRKYTLFIRGFYRYKKNPMCVVQETRFFFWTIPKLLQKCKPYCITGGLISKTLCNISSFSQTRNSNNAITSTLINNIIINRSKYIHINTHTYKTSEVISFKTLPQLSYVVYYGQLPPPPVLLTGKHSSLSLPQVKNSQQSTGMIYGTNCSHHILHYFSCSVKLEQNKIRNLRGQVLTVRPLGRHTWSFTLSFTLICTDTTGRFSLTVAWVKLQHELTLFSLILQLWKLSYSHLATLPPLSPLDHKEAVRLKIWKRPTTTPKPLQ